MDMCEVRGSESKAHILRYTPLVFYGDSLLTYVRLHQSLLKTGGLAYKFEENSTIKQGKKQGFGLAKCPKSTRWLLISLTVFWKWSDFSYHQHMLLVANYSCGHTGTMDDVYVTSVGRAKHNPCE
jgi:hypothetical protein